MHNNTSRIEILLLLAFGMLLVCHLPFSGLGICDARGHSNMDANGARSRVLLSSTPITQFNAQSREKRESREDHKGDGATRLRQYKNRRVGKQRP